jgi:hypothetical protein
MARFAARVTDKRVLKLIRVYLDVVSRAVTFWDQINRAAFAAGPTGQRVPQCVGRRHRGLLGQTA